MSEWIEERGDSVRIRVRVQPRASRTEIVGEHDGALRVRITAPPVEGEANEALIRFFAKRLRVARSRIEVIAGASSRSKVLEVDGVTVDDVAGRLRDV